MLELKKIPNNNCLSDVVRQMIEQYLQSQGDMVGKNLYQLIIKEVELPLLEVTLKKMRGNKTKAAEVLGINRNTLHKKMQEYKL